MADAVNDVASANTDRVNGDVNWIVRPRDQLRLLRKFGNQSNEENRERRTFRRLDEPPEDPTHLESTGPVASHPDVEPGRGDGVREIAGQKTCVDLLH